MNNEPGWEMLEEQRMWEEEYQFPGSFSQYWAQREQDMRDQRAFWDKWDAKYKREEN